MKHLKRHGNVVIASSCATAGVIKRHKQAIMTTIRAAVSTPVTCQCIICWGPFARLNNREISQAGHICQIDLVKVRLAVNLKPAQREAALTLIAITRLLAINLLLQYL